MSKKKTTLELSLQRQARLQQKKELAALRAEILPEQAVRTPAEELRFKTVKFCLLHYLTMVKAYAAVWLLNIVGLIPIIGWFFVLGPVQYGQTAYALRLRAGKSPDWKVLFSGFTKENYGRAAAWGVRVSLLLLCWALLLVVPMVYKLVEYAFSMEILVTRRDLEPLDSINRSRGWMKKNVSAFLRKGWDVLLIYFVGLVTVVGWIFAKPLLTSYDLQFSADIQERLAKTKPDSDSILEIRNVKKYFPTSTDLFGRPLGYVRAVDDVSLSVGYGKTLGIVGESGCGKTTLGRTILGLHDITSGNVYFMGNNIGILMGSEQNKLRTDLQVIFQDPYSSLSPRMPVGEIIAEGVRVHKIVPNAEVRSYVMSVMQKCGLRPQYYDRYPHEFSGGQRQRICIARALAVKPKFVVCDEPVSALDVSIQAQIINLLKDLQREMNLTYLFISHDLSVVEHISDEVGVMYLGSFVEKGTTEQIFKQPLHPYTQALLSAVPVPDPKVKMNRTILHGDIPSPANPPKGCKFHTRCEKCMEICKTEVPAYREFEPGHFCACHLYDAGRGEEA